MLKRKFIGKIGVGLLTSAALFSFILPTEEASATFYRNAKLVMVRKTLPNAGTHRITAELQKFGRNYNHAEATVDILPR